MKQTRRGFLGTIAALAAVAAAPAVEVAEARETVAARYSATTMSDGGAAQPGMIDPASVKLAPSTAPRDGWDYRLLDDAENVAGPPARRLYTIPPTFEMMQADCAARGCELDMRDVPGLDGLVWCAHAARDTGVVFYTGDFKDLARVDAWRRGLHEREATP